MFGMKKMFKGMKISAISILATGAIQRGDMESAQKRFDELTEYSLEDLQKAYMSDIKMYTSDGDIEEILDASDRFPENALELITLVWKDDVDGIMDLMGNDKATFVGTFASILSALIDSQETRKGK